MVRGETRVNPVQILCMHSGYNIHIIGVQNSLHSSTSGAGEIFVICVVCANIGCNPRISVGMDGAKLQLN